MAHTLLQRLKATIQRWVAKSLRLHSAGRRKVETLTLNILYSLRILHIRLSLLGVNFECAWWEKTKEENLIHNEWGHYSSQYFERKKLLMNYTI